MGGKEEEEGDCCVYVSTSGVGSGPEWIGLSIA
jgi:hypothetical protein